VISDSSNKYAPIRTFASLALVILANVVCGCDSSPSNTTMPTTKVLDKPLPQEKLEKWVGEGAAKHKEPLSREEKLKMLHEMSKKSG
jgi:hypothetical protein